MGDGCARSRVNRRRERTARSEKVRIDRMTLLPPHLRSLNPEQRRAAQHTDGPLLILAGAGSGKTKTLVHRVVHLIREAGVRPDRIAAVTFTNKAADEMRERVAAYAGDEARRVTVSTFHALGARILRAHGERLGLPKRFAIYATGDQLGALRTACAEVSLGDDAFDLKRIHRRISAWKSAGVTPGEAIAEVKRQTASGTRADDYAVLAADTYPRYEDVLRACGAVDFDDLLLRTVELLERDETVRRELWKRWHYLMIDEYQDTNGIQLRLARLLAGLRRNLCVVGDDDQSIYAFRGADVNNILEFERHFPGAKIIALEQNYRSTRRILGVANAVIAANAHRHAKRLRTENGIGAPVELRAYEDEQAESEGVAKEIALRRFTGKRNWGDFAVLYRTNPQARPLEEALRAQNIPYRVIGGTAFFDRKEVADTLAYLRAVANPEDEIALRRIVNYPARGIGRTTVLRLVEIAGDRAISFGSALAACPEEVIGPAPAAAVRAFLDLLSRARAGLAFAEQQARSPAPSGSLPPIAGWAKAFFDEVGLEAAIRTEQRSEKSADARVDNLRDVVGTIARYERKRWAQRIEAQLIPAAAEEVHAGSGWQPSSLPDGGTATGSSSPPAGDAASEPADDAVAGIDPPTLADALAHLVLATDDNRDDGGPHSGAVTLMTLHSAKGLEFDDVFLIGLEEGILPHARSLHETEDGPGTDLALAEERRLLYVGITRARRRLALSHYIGRRRVGSIEPVLPSRFIEAIPDDLLEVRAAGAPALSAEESADLRQNFMANMRSLLGGG
jgi:DNA helicase II / ATP-dependent DNA helicase PcrA